MGSPSDWGLFIGGLNTASDPTAIADAELSELMNLELDIDGSLVSRPGFKELAGHTDWTERILLIGEGIFSGTHYLIGSNTNGVYQMTGGTWTLITSTFQATVAIQYADVVYLVAKPGSANPGGKWSPSGGFTAVSAIPKGQAAAIHKERLFICPGITATTNASRLSFSDPGNFESWPGSNFIDISPGDGSKLADLTVFQDNLLLFKDFATYVLAYDTKPTDAVLRKISNTIGANRQFCVANYENQVYVFHEGWVYEIISYDFNRLNTKVPFIRDDTVPGTFTDEKIFISIFEDRLICRYYRNIYVYGLRTRTWSQWESIDEFLHYFGPVVTIRPSTGNEYYAGSCVSSQRTVIQLRTMHSTSSKEEGLYPEYTVVDTFTRSASNGWGTSDSGHVWTNTGGSNSDYSVTGSEGKIAVGSVNVSRWVTSSPDIVDVEVLVSVSTGVLATGAAQHAMLVGRYVDTSNCYFARVAFNTDATIVLSIRKLVGGTDTQLVASGTVGTHIANTKYSIRFQVQGTNLRAKFWTTSANEPLTWTLTTTDSALTAAGKAGVRAHLATGNTNTLPVNYYYDNLSISSMANTIKDITCSAKTKNFDMAISHQFKRLWWWGADIASNRNVIGIAAPVIVTFDVTWTQIEAFTWNQVKPNSWDQPLTEVSGVSTTVLTGVGIAKRFVKFLKSLRYRQINFKVQLVTNGSTDDGPARIFTMTIITESKQVVSKAVS